MRRVRRVLGWVAMVGLGAGIGAFLTLRPGPLVLHQDAVVAGAPAPAAVSRFDAAGNFLDIGPADAEHLFIFYPGGLVRPQAYEWLGVALVPYGVRTIIPVMPFDLAVLASDRAGALLDTLQPLPEKVTLGGHSLGGAMAARSALRHAERLHGLVLMGAYSARGDDLSGLGLRVLDLAAEHDGLASLEKVQKGLERLPLDAQLTIIPGAVHAFFGRYGPQRGDGIPTVSRTEAEMAITAALSSFLNGRD